MARRVFISFLGTNNYLQTHYELNGIVSSPVRFIQQALIESLCKDWKEKDCVMIFYTGGNNGSYKKNWLDNGQTFFNEDENVESMGLYSILKGMDIPMSIEGYEISEGFSEEDIWSIFNCVYDKLQEHDEIYFDVTHAFRSIPLFSTVLFNYARFMKQTRLVSIHYGAFEKLGPVRAVLQIPLEQRIAPIIDLTSLVELQNTNVAASNFVEFGDVGTIAGQLDTDMMPDSKKQRSAYMAIQCLKSELTKLNDYIQTCRMGDIREGKYMKQIMAQFNTAMRAEHLQVSERLLLRKIKEHLSNFKAENTDDNIAAAVEWACRYNMLQQTYTLGQEFVISKVASLLNDRNPFDKSEKKRFRLYVGGLLGVPDGAVYKDDLAEYPELTDEFLASDWMKALRTEYDVLRKNRNALNHAKGGNKSVAMLKNEFRTSYDRCLEIIDRVK